MTEPFRALVGLIGGPPAAIRITPPEIEIIRAMVDHLAWMLPREDRDPAVRTLRELDVRLGASLAFYGDQHGPDFGIPLVPDEHADLRRVYDSAAARTYGLKNTEVVDLMSQLDRRIGAAQAAYVSAAAHHPMPQHATAAVALAAVRTETPR